MSAIAERRVALPLRELRAIARELLSQPEIWEPLVDHTPEQRNFALLRHDDEVTAYVISWMDGHDTGYHDHDISGGAMAVARGKVCEERLRVGGPPVPRVYGEGAVLDFQPSDIHRVKHAPGEPAVTIHVYSPPLQRTGAYVVDPGGTLRRQPMEGDDELRPLIG